MFVRKDRAKLCHNSVEVGRKYLTRLLFVSNGVL